MKKNLCIFAFVFALFALQAHAALEEMAFADRIVCEVQDADGKSLRRLNWQQGTTPLVDLYVLRRGRPIATDTSVTARLVFGSSATAALYGVATNYAATNNSYLVQLPTIGTNSAAAENGLWWYTVYFDRSGKTFWTGSGELVIEETTSTGEDGLTWQPISFAEQVTAHNTNTVAHADIRAMTTNATDAVARSHLTESSNTVHGGFIKTAYDWATNAYAYAGRAWDQATNALAVAQIVHAWGDHADAGYVTGDVVRAENDSVFTNWLGPVPPDPWSNPQFVDFGQRSPSGLWSLIFNAGVTLVSSVGDDFTVNDNLGAPLLELSQTVGAQVYPEIYALGGLRAPNSSGTNAITPSGLIDIGPSLQKADAALQPASTNGWTVTSHYGLVPANRTITVNGATGTLDSNVTFTVTGSTDAPAWIAATNTELAITITNDLERPQYLYATGAVSLAFTGLRPPQPFYLIVSGPDSMTFPANTHFVGGASWQTNQANHFIVWQTGTNLFVNPVTTSEIP